jgi:hypothetical protein
MEYRVKRQDEFPSFLPKGLTNKFNCAMIAASGNGEQHTFVFQGYRVDGPKIDEHQYIASFDLKNGRCYAGFIDHADYSERTTDIPKEMLECMNLSGVKVNFRFDRKPPNDTGSLKDLQNAGLIAGFSNTVDVQNKKR